MLLFWLFGVLAIFLMKVFDFFDLKFSYDYDCTEILIYIIIVLIALCMFVTYQIFFICVLSPFMIISFFYHKFFDKIPLFFEMY